MDLFKPILSEFTDRLKKIDQDTAMNNGVANKSIDSNDELFKLASDSFVKLNQAYDLKYDETDWKLCLLYLAFEKQRIYSSKTKQLPFKRYHSISNENEQENATFLFSKLSESDLKASNFIQNMLKTLRMINASNSLHESLSKLESKYNVTSVLFSKYRTIFQLVFRQLAANLVCIQISDNRRVYMRTGREVFDLSDLFDFGWILFVLIKEYYPQLSGDLVNSYHLLICSVNFLLVNAINSKMAINATDLKDDIVYKNTECDPIKVKTINEHYFMPRVKESCSEVFQSPRFDLADLRSINNQLKSVVSRKNSVEFDEMMFLHRNVGKYDGDVDLLSISVPSSLEAVFKPDNSCQIRSVVEGVLSPVEVDELDEIVNVEKYSVVFKDEIWNRIDIYYQDGLSQLKVDLEKLIEQLIKLTDKFYYHAIWKSFYNEKKRISAENFRKFLNVMKREKLFYQSIYVCCFETILNFGQINSSQKCSEKPQKLVEYLSLLSEENLTFPWSLKRIEIQPFEMVRFIELFIKTNGSVQSNVHMTTTAIATSNGIKKTVYSTNTQEECSPASEVYLDREMVRYLSSCEAKIVESLAWTGDSTIWEKLAGLELNLNYSMSVRACDIEMGAHLNTSLLFPLYDDVFNSAESVNAAGVNKQPSTTLTRVVCNHQNSDSANKSGKKIQVITLTQPSNISQTPKSNCSQAQNRLLNLNFYLSYFFRKFYILASIRIKHLINKLNLVNIYADRVSAKSSTSNSSLSLSSTPIAFTTPYNSSNGANVIINNNSSPTALSQAQLSETYQIIYKKIWLVFEYSISNSSSSENGNDTSNSLLKNRHMDQLIMCSIYIVCRISGIEVHFKDILSAYRQFDQATNNRIYREVVINGDVDDIVAFYNKIFVLRLKSYSLDLSKHFKQLPQSTSPSPMSTPSSISLSSHFITPVNSSGSGSNLVNGNGPTVIKNTASLNPTPTASVQFSPRKILNRNSVFISPTKSNSTGSNRNKLDFSLRSRDLVKSMRSINEMIKKNEIKIKTSNKRLFSEISSQNMLPSVVKNESSEPDGKSENFTDNFAARINPTFLINNRSSFINIGPNFSKKLKTVLKEKSVLE